MLSTTQLLHIVAFMGMEGITGQGLTNPSTQRHSTGFCLRKILIGLSSTLQRTTKLVLDVLVQIRSIHLENPCIPATLPLHETSKQKIDMKESPKALPIWETLLKVLCQQKETERTSTQPWNKTFSVSQCVITSMELLGFKHIHIIPNQYFIELMTTISKKSVILKMLLQMTSFWKNVMKSTSGLQIVTMILTGLLCKIQWTSWLNWCFSIMD